MVYFWTVSRHSGWTFSIALDSPFLWPFLRQVAVCRSQRQQCVATSSWPLEEWQRWQLFWLQGEVGWGGRCVHGNPLCPGSSLDVSHFSCVWLFVIPWTVACQAPLSMEFSRQEYWNGLPFRLNQLSRSFRLVYVCILSEVSKLTNEYGLPRWHSGKESACQCRRCKRCEFNPWIGKIPWRRKWQSTPVFLFGKSHVQRSLVGYSPWGCE